MLINDYAALASRNIKRETKMNKKELVGALADHCGTTQAQARVT